MSCAAFRLQCVAYAALPVPFPMRLARAVGVGVTLAHLRRRRDELIFRMQRVKMPHKLCNIFVQRRATPTRGYIQGIRVCDS